MKKLVQPLALSSLFLLFMSCTSDDSNLTDPIICPTVFPTPENHYYVSDIKVTSFDFNFEHNENGSYEIKTHPDQGLTFDFSYTEDFKLTGINNSILLYENNEVIYSVNTIFDYNFNEKNQLANFGIFVENTLLRSQSYTYNDDLVASTVTRDPDGTQTQTFTYNDKKQFISSLLQPKNARLTYSYNGNDQLNSLSINNEKLEFTYDDKKNPFATLPFDLTTIIHDELEFIPLTYRFANNINFIKNPDQEVFTIEYQYNTDNYPTKATIYQTVNKTKVIYKTIDFTYQVQKVEMEK